MNERMIELYKEACEFAYGVCKEEGRPGGVNDNIWNTLSTGRFAELVWNEAYQQGFDAGFDEAKELYQYIDAGV